LGSVDFPAPVPLGHRLAARCGEDLATARLKLALAAGEC